MDERDLQATFGSDYSPPQSSSNDWDDWANTIELKVSRQGQLLLGLGVGLAVTLILTGMNGRVIIRLTKGHAMLVDAINMMVGGTPDRATVSYSEPTGRIDESKIEPVDEQELKDLQERIVPTNEPRFDEDM